MPAIFFVSDTRCGVDAKTGESFSYPAPTVIVSEPLDPAQTDIDLGPVYFWQFEYVENFDCKTYENSR
jgi:hypothetical protein